MHNYLNGNCSVSISEDGTKIREYSGEPRPDFPESIDVKITNYCDVGCAYCHEMSTTKGKHGNLSRGLELLEKLPPGVELACGGGCPLSHPDLVSFLKELRARELIPNLTVNAKSIKPNQELISKLITEKLVFGLGISYNGMCVEEILNTVKQSSNVVVHMVLGITSTTELDNLRRQASLQGIDTLKVLLLGYKTVGRGIKFKETWAVAIESRITQWYQTIPHLLKKSKKKGCQLVLSFDNLAIEQLNLKRCFTKKGWDKFYMGDDGQFTMYVDLVEEQFAVSSTSQDRKELGNLDIFEVFKSVKKM